MPDSPTLDPPDSTRARDIAPHSRFGTFLAYLYLLRVPVLIAIVLIAFPFVALLPTPARSLFQNFFVLEWQSSLVASLATLMVTWSVVLNGLVVLFNASDRFSVPSFLTQDFVRDQQQKTRWSIGLVTAVIATPLLAGQFLQGDWQLPHPWLNLSGVVAGALLAYVVAYVSLLLVMFLVPSAIAVANEVFPAPGFLQGG